MKALVPYGSNQFNIADLLPQPPWLGPPLPRFLGITWPWVQNTESFFPLPPYPETPSLTTYENIEEIELVDIDPDLLMPRRIVVHRKSKRLD